MTDSPASDRPSGTHRLISVLLLSIAGFGAWDLASDSPNAWRGAHAYIELGFILLSMVSALVLGIRWQRAERSLVGAERAIAVRQRERDEWRRRAESALRGFGEAMDAQFSTWGLTPAEKETALLLLKGYSHKEVARLRKGSERTVRQHAVSVYRKSALSGRAELAAFFFEDVLLPFAPESAGDGGAGAPDSGDAARPQLRSSNTAMP
jgi:DNA-binding CsgD family transcriptional regulator